MVVIGHSETYIPEICPIFRSHFPKPSAPTSLDEDYDLPKFSEHQTQRKVSHEKKKEPFYDPLPTPWPSCCFVSIVCQI